MSATVEVLKQITTDTKVFSYRDDFAHLWKLHEKASNIVIVWDGIPKGDTGAVNTSRYLTPIDWAVAFSLSVYDKAIAAKTGTATPEYRDLRIIILDLNSHLVSNADGVRFLKQFPKALQWVKIMGPLQADELIESLRNPMELKSMKEAIEASDMELIRRVWASNLTKPSTPGDHHAIANLVGPLLLMGDDSSDDQHVKALKKVMKTLGLIPQMADDVPFPWIDWDAPDCSEKLKRVSSAGKLNLILIDDQYHQGWGKVLCTAVGADYAKVGSEASPEIEEIGTHFTADGKQLFIKASASAASLLSGLDGKDQRFNLNICGDASKDAEILFLDLRLFSGRPLAEGKFINDLCDIAMKFVDNNDSKEAHWEGIDVVKGLPWPGFSSSEIENVRKWCASEKRNKDGEDREYIEALTFLPRIIALSDLSLPIVLFSSTGRRDITNKLKEYRNIITDFDKPKFTVDIPEDIAKQTRTKFQKAITMALAILDGRQICVKVNSLACNASFSRSMTTVTQPYSHIEIYLDESGEVGKTSFAVGGLICAYPSYHTVKQLSDGLERNGYYWYSKDDSNTDHLSKEPFKQNERYQGQKADIHWLYDEAHDLLAELSKKNGVFTAAVRLVEDHRAYLNNNDRHFPCKNDLAEATYIRVLSALLELTLYEMIPQWSNRCVSISVFTATRTIRLKLMGTLASSETPNDYYGYGKHPLPDKYYTISDSSITPIVADILNKRELPKNLTIHHARAVYLTYGVPVINPKTGKISNKNSWNDIRVQHYFADHMAKGMSNKALDCYLQVFERGFNETLDADLAVLLEAQNDLLNNNVPYAIKLASTCNNASSNIRRHIIERFLKPLSDMDGLQFVNLCSLNEAADPGSSRREVFTVKDVSISPWNKVALKCCRENGTEVIATENQTRKLGPRALSISRGDRVWGVFILENGKAYARNIAF